jgi:hypothetical protein
MLSHSPSPSPPAVLPTTSGMSLIEDWMSMRESMRTEGGARRYAQSDL